MEVCIFTAFSKFFSDLQRLAKGAKDNLIEDLKPTSDGHLLLNNSKYRFYINSTRGACKNPSNRSIIAYQELGIMIIFIHFQYRQINYS